MFELVLGFLLGAYLGDYSLVFRSGYIIAIIAIYVFSVIIWKSHSTSPYIFRFLCLLGFLFGLIWGGLHNRREAKLNHASSALVLRGNSHGLVGRHVLVRLDAAALIVAKGVATKGDRGKIRCQTYRQRPKQFSCNFRVTMSIRYWRPNRWLKIAKSIENSVRSNAMKQSYPWAGWLQALLLGDWTRLAKNISENFHQLGLVHLLVLSGFHFSLIFLTLEKLLFGLCMPFYLLRFCSAGRWLQIQFVKTFIIIISGLFYLLAVGLTHPSLRAFLIYVCLRLGNYFWGVRKKEALITLAMLGQILILPYGFWEKSNLLSWLAYLWLISRWWSEPSREKTWKQKLIEMIQCQVGIAAFNLPILGLLASSSLLANLLIGPIFQVVFVICVIWILMPESALVSRIAVWVLDLFMFVIEKFAMRSHMLKISPALSQGLTLFLITALICYALSWWIKQRQQLIGKRNTSYD